MPRTLLLADDSHTIQRVVELTFADEDIAVVTVSDGNHAIDVLNRTPPDIVLADIGMPGSDGYAVAQHIKDTPALSHIPVLLLTGAFEQVDHAKALEAGCDGILAKPFEPRLVIRRVRELLAKPKVPSPPPEPVVAAVPHLPSGENGHAVGPTPAASTNGTAPHRNGHEAPAFQPQPQTSQDVERYFEQLDQAFAALTGAPSTPAAPFASTARQDGVKPAHGMPAQMPSLIDAFTALLAAERVVEPQPADPSWQVVAPLASAPPAVSETDALTERVLSRVLERLHEYVTRDVVSDIVTATAERLVREEIERIKSNIK